jgi:hypothetical protein
MWVKKGDGAENLPWVYFHAMLNAYTEQKEEKQLARNTPPSQWCLIHKSCELLFSWTTKRDIIAQRAAGARVLVWRGKRVHSRRG